MTDGAPRCDCGYTCRGATADDQAEDGRRHALTAHGIDVGADRVLSAGSERAPAGAPDSSG